MSRILGMAILDERPVWSMSSSEKLTALDAARAEIARLQVRCLHLTAGLDTDGHAQELGARDTVQLLSVRYRQDPADVRRDLRLARALHKYPAVSAALGTGRPTEADRAQPTITLEQAAAIVTALEKVPVSARVPVEDLRVAEESMVEAADLLAPPDLRTLGQEVRARLDTDGPQPSHDPDNEDDASSREALWLKPADRGVTFGGYLANENAELFQTLVFAGAKPHKTPDGERDPRPRSKRQADALTGILTTAAGAGTAVPGHGDIKPHITVTIDLKDLQAATNTPGAPAGQEGPGNPGNPGNSVGLGGSGLGVLGIRGRGDLVHGGTLSAAAVRRLACDAGIIPPRPRLQLRTPRRRSRTPLRHPRHPPSPQRPRQRLHRLRRTTRHLRSPPHHPLGRRRPHLPPQPRPALQTRPHQRPPRPTHHHLHQRPPHHHPPHLVRPRPTPSATRLRRHGLGDTACPTAESRDPPTSPGRPGPPPCPHGLGNTAHTTLRAGPAQFTPGRPAPPP
ncbi:DUF222 domain-containing protein [Kribbella speibonae]|uniref:DUF222 domain-containing protein n=1 Tax=Kribbella speibonae TaxID=1572660 RepID=A0A4R0IVL9_9ACTN|nr:DUF222 domain-containing protein [Kribbella speibonae]